MKKENNQEKISTMEIELLEYKLTEKIQSTILARAKYVFAAFIAGLTLLNIAGGAYIVEHVSQRTEREIRRELKEEAQNLKKGLQDRLAELTLSAKEILKESEKAREQLNKLKGSYRELQIINSQYSSLYNKVDDLNLEIKEEISGVKTRLEAESKHAIASASLGVSNISDRIAALDSLVVKIGEALKVNTVFLDSYEKQKIDIENTAEKERKLFSQNSDYYIQIRVTFGKVNEGSVLQTFLAEQGFKADLIAVEELNTKTKDRSTAEISPQNEVPSYILDRIKNTIVSTYSSLGVNILKVTEQRLVPPLIYDVVITLPNMPTLEN